ncbi:hypothetical protein J5226_16585 [Lysobacter sp. K5869]|uniref:DUF4175 domain-containing protein n=1 Tax=Lysobacter sp. K5869 TaxID=2820808 RepID=UPI001C06495A|nr:DUF4175 domain-containing protein [Lysobacter sp. K5869]QWP75235.1 hypothetical protein J5226_16585 [Lysobacter sp. K5869]
MSAIQQAQRWHGQARHSRAIHLALVWGVWLVPLFALSARWFGAGIACAATAFGIVWVAWRAWRGAVRLDREWLVRRLNALRSDMDDSADLLFAESGSLRGLQRLQRARLERRIEAGPQTDVREPPSWRALAACAAIALALTAAAALWPQPDRLPAELALSPAPPVAAAPGQPRLIAQALRIEPPGYTGLPAREEPGLEGRVPEGATLRWRLRFEPQPAQAALVFHDGERLPLRRDGETWSAQRALAKSSLYRIDAAGAPQAQTRRLYRLDVVPDRPPQLRVLQPERGLTLLARGQKTWPLAFEASDDYGVAATARLRIVLAQGSGEQITFRERSVALRGSGGATAKRFVHALDLAALGFAVGDDLIVQLSASDNRAPQPQTALSPSLILRWPADPGSEATGIEGMVKTVLPAYFRSQRQIIIDAEALIAQRRKLDGDAFVKKSDAIGVDQRLLRLRYGQFLGEEAEGEPKLPTSDSEDEHAHEGEGHDVSAPADAHDHAPAAAAGADKPVFGEAGAVLEEYGHTHDHAEAATLLDPQTRALLKSALDQMWQSELHLRQGQPQQALPFAYKALGFIKQVQQASRIYLARVGPELPPIDESRRLSGDRTGLARREDALAPASAADPLPARLWRELQAPASQPVDYAALERWLGANQSRVPDPLAFAAALAALRDRPDCGECRARLRGLLWPLLQAPATTVRARDAGDARDRRYFDALRQEAQ